MFTEYAFFKNTERYRKIIFYVGIISASIIIGKFNKIDGIIYYIHYEWATIIMIFIIFENGFVIFVCKILLYNMYS